MLREADTNGDGQISREEFYDLLKDNHAQDTLSLYDDRWGGGEYRERNVLIDGAKMGGQRGAISKQLCDCLASFAGS